MTLALVIAVEVGVVRLVAGGVFAVLDVDRGYRASSSRCRLPQPGCRPVLCGHTPDFCFLDIEVVGRS